MKEKLLYESLTNAAAEEVMYSCSPVQPPSNKAIPITSSLYNQDAYSSTGQLPVYDEAVPYLYTSQEHNYLDSIILEDPPSLSRSIEDEINDSMKSLQGPEMEDSAQSDKRFIPKRHFHRYSPRAPPSFSNTANQEPKFANSINRYTTNKSTYSMPSSDAHHPNNLVMVKQERRVLDENVLKQLWNSSH